MKCLPPAFARRAMEAHVPKYELPQGEMLPEIEERCVNMIARLWNSPDDEEAVGTSTIGSSEAAMLSAIEPHMEYPGGSSLYLDGQERPGAGKASLSLE